MKKKKLLTKEQSKEIHDFTTMGERIMKLYKEGKLDIVEMPSSLEFTEEVKDKEPIKPMEYLALEKALRAFMKMDKEEIEKKQAELKKKSKK